MNSKEVKPKNKGGRPLAKVDQTEFEKLCAIQCTKLEICGWLKIEDDTLEKWCKRTYNKGFSEVFKLKRGTGFISLRRAQFQMAQTNVAMNIWLSKQFLGQKEPDQFAQQEQPEAPEFAKMTNEQLEDYIKKNKGEL